MDQRGNRFYRERGELTEPCHGPEGTTCPVCGLGAVDAGAIYQRGWMAGQRHERARFRKLAVGWFTRHPSYRTLERMLKDIDGEL